MTRRPGHFNPRTRMGCDSLIRRLREWQSRFQSTHPHGVRLAQGIQPRALLRISIHAPAWGATISRPSKKFFLIFQSTHPHGVRQAAGESSEELLEFQSTHPHGVRRVKWSAMGSLSNFNPRTRMGCDFDNNNKFAQVIISIHAPAWGATNNTDCKHHNTAQFQSTHPHGVRPHRSSCQDRLFHFNPRTRMGCDQ